MLGIFRRAMSLAVSLQLLSAVGDTLRPIPTRRRRRLLEDVADAADRVDQARLPGRLQLTPQIADVDLHDIRRSLEVEPPDRIQNDLARKHLTRPTHEEAQQLVLGRRELDLACGAVRDACAGVQL